jgi:hypothetical protein
MLVDAKANASGVDDLKVSKLNISSPVASASNGSESSVSESSDSKSNGDTYDSADSDRPRKYIVKIKSEN